MNNPNLPVEGSEWSYEQHHRVIVQECRKRGRGCQVVYGAYLGYQCQGIHKARLRDFMAYAKPL